jgi:hypothetical protein
METVRRALDVDGMSYHPCGGPCKGRHTGLGGHPGGHHAARTHGGQILENERELRCMPGCWDRAKLPNVDSQPGREVSACGGGRDRIPQVSAGENRTPVRLTRFSSRPSKHCKSPRGPTGELRSNAHQCGT